MHLKIEQAGRVGNTRPLPAAVAGLQTMAPGEMAGIGLSHPPADTGAPLALCATSLIGRLPASILTALPQGAGLPACQQVQVYPQNTQEAEAHQQYPIKMLTAEPPASQRPGHHVHAQFRRCLPDNTSFA